ncbi:hypothetical protein IAD21_03556 [Abditibacteriota bacterium]|nr:hypothetical protein IAD21_03556 [Abditibacteriota bacterium]
MPDDFGVPYPTTSREQTRWILERRPARNTVDARRPYAYLNEPERAQNGEVVPVATLFLTNRECPFRCLMCDLWSNTLTESVSRGDIPAQIDLALSELPPARQIKLYNSGSFFDPRAIPPDDYLDIAARVRGFERVIVECHPSFVGERCFAFQKLLDADGEGRLEVAMGLETVHPAVLERLNKGITLESFRATADALRERSIALRVFILVKPPFQDEVEALEWSKRSLDFAFDCGASVACLIPTRDGNGALEALREQDEWSQPQLATLEKAANYGVGLSRGRVFADVWDLERFSNCPSCFAARRERLDQMNLTQTVLPSICCAICGEGQ